MGKSKQHIQIQKLVTELAIAESNVKRMTKVRKVSFDEEVTKAFQTYNIDSYLDLVKIDMEKALELRKLAHNEELLATFH